MYQASLLQYFRIWYLNNLVIHVTCDSCNALSEV